MQRADEEIEDVAEWVERPDQPKGRGFYRIRYMHGRQRRALSIAAFSVTDALRKAREQRPHAFQWGFVCTNVDPPGHEQDPDKYCQYCGRMNTHTHAAQFPGLLFPVAARSKTNGDGQP